MWRATFRYVLRLARRPQNVLRLAAVALTGVVIGYLATVKSAFESALLQKFAVLLPGPDGQAAPGAANSWQTPLAVPTAVSGLPGRMITWLTDGSTLSEGVLLYLVPVAAAAL